MYSFGETDSYTVLAMQLLGKNLSEIRRDCVMKPQRMSVRAVFGIAAQSLAALKILHDCGYVHRDFKPWDVLHMLLSAHRASKIVFSSNVTCGARPCESNTIYVIDFGLCRRFTDPDGRVKDARPDVGFRGTVRYASANAHAGSNSCLPHFGFCLSRKLLQAGTWAVPTTAGPCFTPSLSFSTAGYRGDTPTRSRWSVSWRPNSHPRCCAEICRRNFWV